MPPLKKSELSPCDHDECGLTKCTRIKTQEITDDREAIRRELKDSRKKHTKHVRSLLP